MKYLRRLYALFAVFFKISAITIGGGMVMIPVMEKEFLDKRKWLTRDDMLDTVALVQSMPGVIAVNMALMIGYRVAKLPGAMVAAFAVVIPPFLTILVIAFFFKTLSGNEKVSEIFCGVRAATSALILISVIKMGKKVLKNPFAITVAVVSFVILAFFPQVNVVYVIIAAGLAGVLFPESVTLSSKLPKEEAKQ